MTEQPTTAAGRALIGSILLALQQEGADVADLSWVDQVADVEAEARQQDGSALRLTRETLAEALHTVPAFFRHPHRSYDRCPCGDFAATILAALPPSAPPADWTDPGITTPNPDGTVSWRPSAPPALDVALLRRVLIEHGFAYQNWLNGDVDLPIEEVREIAAEYARLEQDR